MSTRHPRRRLRGSELKLISGVLSYYPPGQPSNVTNISVGPNTCLTELETFDDFVGGRRRRTYNGCRHRKYSFTRRNYPVGWVDQNVITLSVPYPIRVNLPQVGGAFANILPSNWDEFSSNYQTFCFDSFTAISTQVPPVIDSLHLIQDVVTVRGLWKQCISLFRSLIGILDRVARHWRQGKRSFSGIFNVFSNIHLVNQFGIQPLKREVMEALDKFQSIGKRLEFLRETQGQVFTARYRRNISLSTSDVTYHVGGSAEFPQNWISSPISSNVVYNTHVRFRNELEGLNNFDAALNAAVGELGLTNVATFAWDLMPWSFVVDWFLHVDKILDRYASIQPFAGKLKIVEAGTSIHLRHDANINFHPCPAYGNPKQSIGRFKYELYTRRPGVEIVVSPGVTGGLTTNQQALLAALVGQRV